MERPSASSIPAPSRRGNAARRAKRTNPDSFVVVTGCYAETQRESLKGMKEVDLVLGNGEKSSLPAIVDAMAESERGALPAHHGAISRVETSEPTGIDRFLGHARAFVKIQEGCNASCSYCIVPRARGPSRSVPAAAVLEQVSVLQESGYREIVLSGVHIGRYGADLDPPGTLGDLLEAILLRASAVRVRLSSIEVNEVTSKLIGIMRSTDRLAPHLHIPLQSGDDRILKAMNRSYDVSGFRRVIEEIARAGDRIAIGTDIIVGFPGETEACFENTFELVRELPISHFHVFGFSPRPRTRAAAMERTVSSERMRERSGRLIELGRAKKRVFLESHVGTTQLVLVHGHAHQRSSLIRSLTGTYCEVLLPRREAARGSLVSVRVSRFSEEALYGTPMEADPVSNPIAGACAR
ncbi:MAG: MiaB/RimO family radical SAM methylthiotransferase [Candidatus Krumholzibacteria bacterium]|nr:MiaB/RimO family radical SAM methylthiotransferase [Candidatus Krumholzibacteria bacterium]